MQRRSHTIRLVLVAALLLCLALLSVGCGASPDASVDRTDPEAVLRAYLDAWERGDWRAQEDYMSTVFADRVPEPISSLEIIELTRGPDSDSTHRLYYVSFEIVVRGDGVSMTSGRYDWSYELEWDEERSSWIITNYGWG